MAQDIPTDTVERLDKFRLLDRALKKANNHLPSKATNRNRAPLDPVSVRRLISTADAVRPHFSHDQILVSTEEANISLECFEVIYFTFPKSEAFGINKMGVWVRHYERNDLAMTQMVNTLRTSNYSYAELAEPTLLPFGQYSLVVDESLVWVHNTHLIQLYIPRRPRGNCDEIDSYEMKGHVLNSIAQILDKHIKDHSTTKDMLKYPDAPLTPLNGYHALCPGEFRLQPSFEKPERIHLKIGAYIPESSQSLIHNGLNGSNGLLTFMCINRAGNAKVVLLVAHSQYLTIRAVEIDVNIANREPHVSSPPRGVEKEAMEALDEYERTGVLREGFGFFENKYGRHLVRTKYMPKYLADVGNNNVSFSIIQRNKAPFDKATVQRIIANTPVVSSRFKYDDLWEFETNQGVNHVKHTLSFPHNNLKNFEEFPVRAISIDVSHFPDCGEAEMKAFMTHRFQGLCSRDLSYEYERTEVPLGQYSTELQGEIKWIHNRHFIEILSSPRSNTFRALSYAVAQAIDTHLTEHLVPQDKEEVTDLTDTPVGTGEYA